MTVLDHAPAFPRTGDIAARMHRRYAIVTTGGMQGLLRVATMLDSCDHPVRDFSADVREGVGYSSLTCTVSLTSDECAAFTDRLRAVDPVVAVDPC